MIVFNIKSEFVPPRLKNAFPLVWRNQIMTNWYTDCPKIFLHITLLMKFPFLPTGNLFIKSSFGGSVANASAPRVSMIMLTHRSWTAVRGEFPESTHISPKEKRGKKEYWYRKRFMPKTLNMIWKGEKIWIFLPVKQAEEKLTTRATTFTVSWNWTNFWMFM